MNRSAVSAWPTCTRSAVLAECFELASNTCKATMTMSTVCRVSVLQFYSQITAYTFAMPFHQVHAHASDLQSHNNSKKQYTQTIHAQCDAPRRVKGITVTTCSVGATNIARQHLQTSEWSAVYQFRDQQQAIMSEHHVHSSYLVHQHCSLLLK